MHSGISKQTIIWDQLQSRTFQAGSCNTGHRDWSNCQRCRLSLTRRRVAIIRRGGEPGHTRILFIGEAPGELEDKTGYPFVGKSGSILEVLLSYVPYQFEYIITNAVGCRPVDLMYLDGDDDSESEYDPHNEPATQDDLKRLKYGSDYTLLNYNRDPTKSEIKACSPHITELLDSFRPQVVVFLGKIAASLSDTVSSYRPSNSSVRLSINSGHSVPAPYIPPKQLTLYHPAFIARMEYKLLTVIKEARKLELLIHDLLA